MGERDDTVTEESTARSGRTSAVVGAVLALAVVAFGAWLVFGGSDEVADAPTTTTTSVGTTQQPIDIGWRLAFANGPVRYVDIVTGEEETLPFAVTDLVLETERYYLGTTASTVSSYDRTTGATVRIHDGDSLMVPIQVEAADRIWFAEYQPSSDVVRAVLVDLADGATLDERALPDGFFPRVVDADGVLGVWSPDGGAESLYRVDDGAPSLVAEGEVLFVAEGRWYLRRCESSGTECEGAWVDDAGAGIDGLAELPLENLYFAMTEDRASAMSIEWLQNDEPLRIHDVSAGEVFEVDLGTVGRQGFALSPDARFVAYRSASDEYTIEELDTGEAWTVEVTGFSPIWITPPGS